MLGKGIGTRMGRDAEGGSGRRSRLKARPRNAGLPSMRLLASVRIEAMGEGRPRAARGVPYDPDVLS